MHIVECPECPYLAEIENCIENCSKTAGHWSHENTRVLENFGHMAISRRKIGVEVLKKKVNVPPSCALNVPTFGVILGQVPAFKRLLE